MAKAHFDARGEFGQTEWSNFGGDRDGREHYASGIAGAVSLGR
jgi:hypothetical protein